MAMTRARDSGRAAASGRVTLKQEIHQDKQAGFLLYLPVYRGGRVPATLEERRERLEGFVYSPFRAGDQWSLPDRTCRQLADLRTVASAEGDRRNVNG